MRSWSVFSIALFLLCVSAWAEWYPGIIHTHSTFSDSDRIPEMVMEEAARSGALFVIITDHYEQIDSSKSVRPDVPKKDFGFENYKKRFSGVPTIGDVPVPLVVITGAEITTGSSHTLALGALSFKDDRFLKQNTQQGVIDRLNELGFLPTAAHPHFQCLSLLRPWGITRYLYDKKNANGLCGVEIFNDHNWKQYTQTRDWYLSLLSGGNDVFVTSGCDSHSGGEPKDVDRWTRKTWVWSEDWDWTSGKLIEAIRKGQTYASNYGASLENLNYIPGFKVQEIDRAEFQFTVVFEKEITSSKTVQIYRDGKLLTESIHQYPKGLKKIEYFFKDDQVQVGKHWYVVDVEGVLITSPIKLRIKQPFSRSTGSGKILFCMEDENNVPFLYTINPDGSGLAKWMQWSYYYSKPTFSPDGKQMIFSSTILKSDGVFLTNFIYSMNLSTGQTKRIFPLKEDYTQSGNFPQISPDGKKVVFEYQRYKPLWLRKSIPGYSTSKDQIPPQRIWIMNSNGNCAGLLNKKLDDLEFPVWSPNCKQIVFSTFTSLVVYDLTKKVWYNLSGQRWSDGPNQIRQEWSPAGDWIVFMSSDVAESPGSYTHMWHDLYLIRPDGSDRHMIVGDVRYIDDLDWSKNAREIALLLNNEYMNPSSGCKLEIVNVQNPSLRRTIFQTDRSIDWLMWNTYNSN